MFGKTMTILLTGTRSPATLDVARRLHAAGVRVVGADSMRFPLGKYSNSLAAHYQLPPPRQAPAEFLQALQRLLDKEQINLLWPTCEEIFHISQWHELLSQQTTLLCEPLATLLPLHHKLQFTEVVRALGTRVQAPESWAAADAPGNERLVWKPYFSRFAAQTRFDEPPLNRDGWMAQRFIDGDEFCSWALCRGGKVHAMTMYRSQARAGRGAGCSFVPHWSEVAAEFVQALASRYNFTGALAFDFMVLPDGQTFVLECNPRMTSGIHLLSPHINLANVLDEPTPLPPAMQAAQMTLPVLFSKPQLALVAPDVVFSESDPAPFWTQFLCAAEFMWRSHREGIPILSATTWDIEYNG